MRTYETTILVNANKARTDFEGTVAAARAVYEAEGAEWIELDKWEERKLAYPIEGEISACYLIGYFKADGDAIDRIERRAQLSDDILRHLIIVRDGHDYDKIRAQRAAAEAAAATASCRCRAPSHGTQLQPRHSCRQSHPRSAGANSSLTSAPLPTSASP